MSKTWAYFFLLLSAAITIGACYTLPKTFFDYDFEKFFKANDPETSYFNTYRETFGTDNDFVLLGIVSKSGVFNPDFLSKIDELTELTAKLPYIKKVISPTNFTLPIREPLAGFIFEKPILTGNRQLDSIEIAKDPTLLNRLFAEDLRSVSIIVITDAKLSKAKCDSVSNSLHRLINQFDFDETHIAGRAIGQVVYTDKLSRELKHFMLISLGFVLILLWIIFRSWRGILIPLATVALAVIWSVGILNVTGHGISILLNMLPPVIFVVGMSDAVHLYARYLDELRLAKSNAEAIKLMIHDTGLATFLTSLTTAVGFASLYFTEIPALQEFGLIVAAGVITAFVISITMLPAVLRVLPPPTILSQTERGSWTIRLKSYFVVIARHRKLIKVAGLLLSIGFCLASGQIERNNFLIEDLRKSEVLHQDFAFFQNHFSGVRPFELGIELRNGQSFITQEHIKMIDRMEIELANNYGVKSIISLSSLTKALHRSRHAGRIAHYKLPESEKDWKLVLADIEKLHRSGKIKSLLNNGFTRISGRVGDWGAQAFTDKNAAFFNNIEKWQLTDYFNLKITGTGTLIDQTNQNLVKSLATGLGIAFLITALIIGLMFRSIKMIIFALIPNIVPLLALGCVMAFAGIQLKLTTSIIFTIAFGIAVDDTIHFLSRYKLELRKGHGNMQALLTAYTKTGKALILTTAVLLGGFISLCFSTFQSTFLVGLLVSLTLIFALICDMVLLPVILLPHQKSKDQ